MLLFPCGGAAGEINFFFQLITTDCLGTEHLVIISGDIHTT